MPFSFIYLVYTSLFLLLRYIYLESIVYFQWKDHFFDRGTMCFPHSPAFAPDSHTGRGLRGRIFGACADQSSVGGICLVFYLILKEAIQ